jgi:hypothetical protein
MKPRTKRYFAVKWAEKRLKTQMEKFMTDLRDDLMWYGMAGTRTYLNEKGEVKIDRLTFRELNEMQQKARNGEVIPKEISLGGEFLISPEMKNRIDQLRQTYNTK